MLLQACLCNCHASDCSDTELIPYGEASLPTYGLLIDNALMFSGERGFGCTGQLWARNDFIA